MYLSSLNHTLSMYGLLMLNPSIRPRGPPALPLCAEEAAREGLVVDNLHVGLKVVPEDREGEPSGVRGQFPNDISDRANHPASEGPRVGVPTHRRVLHPEVPGVRMVDRQEGKLEPTLSGGCKASSSGLLAEDRKR